MREDVSRTEAEIHKAYKYIPNSISFSRFFKIIMEFRKGFTILRKYDLAVTFFGSSRSSFDDDVYKRACELAGKLSKDGFTVITGGGNGVMEAANKGAYVAGGSSVGLNIELPAEQQLNKYLTDSQSFDHFFIRKVMLSFASEAYIFFPGGFGTMDEFFEIITLIQTKKIQQIPVVLIDKGYWQPLLDWIEQSLYKENNAINKEDMKIYYLVETVEEAHELINTLVSKMRA